MDFLIVALIFSLSIGLFAGLVIANNTVRSSKILRVVLVVVITIIIGMAFSAFFMSIGAKNAEIWNEGFCPNCNVHWHPNGVTRRTNGIATKYYYCPKCYKEISIN